MRLSVPKRIKNDNFLGFLFDEVLLDNALQDLTTANIWRKIYDDSEKYLMLVEIPGVPESAVDIDVKDGVLTIEIEHKFEEPCIREYCSYKRKYCLPGEVDTDRITAKLKDGVLTLTLPKIGKAVADGKKVTINAE